jgi:hypothetical protein
VLGELLADREEKGDKWGLLLAQADTMVLLEPVGLEDAQGEAPLMLGDAAPLAEKKDPLARADTAPDAEGNSVEEAEAPSLEDTVTVAAEEAEEEAREREEAEAAPLPLGGPEALLQGLDAAEALAEEVADAGPLLGDAAPLALGNALALKPRDSVDSAVSEKQVLLEEVGVEDPLKLAEAVAAEEGEPLASPEREAAAETLCGADGAPMREGCAEGVAVVLQMQGAQVAHGRLVVVELAAVGAAGASAADAFEGKAGA